MGPMRAHYVVHLTVMACPAPPSLQHLCQACVCCTALVDVTDTVLLLCRQRTQRCTWSATGTCTCQVTATAGCIQLQSLTWTVQTQSSSLQCVTPSAS